MDKALLRSTFIVADIEAAIRFYRDVFGLSIAYDNILAVDRRFPPAAPDGAPCRLVIFRGDGEDPEIGRAGRAGRFRGIPQRARFGICLVRNSVTALATPALSARVGKFSPPTMRVTASGRNVPSLSSWGKK